MNYRPNKSDVFATELKGQQIAILVSGGIESAILLSLASKYCAAVYPIYINSKTTWSAAELSNLPELLLSINSIVLKPLTVLELPVNDLYGSHWSLTGNNTPDDTTADEAVYLPGRNLLFLAKVSVWCALNKIPAVALGTLKSNPFTDATPKFFSSINNAIEIALSNNLNIYTPLIQFTKIEAMQLLDDFPWEKTFSCFNPIFHKGGYLHCGECNKCGERKAAFIKAKVTDKSKYGLSAAQ